MSQDMLNLLSDLIAKARKGGADAADAIFVEGSSMSFSQRLGEPEQVERSEGRDLGLRVLMGKRQAMVSSSDTAPEALDELLERALAMAKLVPEDPYCGIAEPGQLCQDPPQLDMCDPGDPDPATLQDWAGRAEDAARAIEGVTNSEGGQAGWGRSRVALVASNGFAQTYENSRWSLSASVLAGDGTAMERDYDYTGAVYAADLRAPEDVGRSAGERAVRRLGARKAPTGRVPVVFDPRVARSLLSHLAGAVSGPSVARKTSFLRDFMGKAVFGDHITIVDDPHRPRGLRSKPFDAEGLPNQRWELISGGKLTTWVLDLASSRQLGLSSTGHASRGTGSPPSPSVTNLYLQPGKQSPEELMADIKEGLYVTELIGFGVNGVTGDYSRGAAGYWIENGKLAYPVSEVTIAGNLKDMFLNMTPADDLIFRYGIDSPTVRLEGLTLAGK